MLMLVLADNLLLLYLGWEGVGLCSYLLIGFWYQDPANGRAARKAFIVTRIGDTALADRPVPARSPASARWTSRAACIAPPAAGRWARRCARGRRTAARRRGRQVGAAAAADLAARRDGRPDAGQRADPRRDDGDRGRLPDRAHPVLFELAPAAQLAVARHRRRDAAARRLQRARPARHQARPRLLHHEPDRLHVPGAGRRRLVGGDVPLHDPRFLQGAAVPRRRRRHPRAAPRARHLPNGRPPAGAAARLLDLPHRRMRRSPALPLVTAGFYSKDLHPLEALGRRRTAAPVLWIAGMVGALLTSLYIFRVDLRRLLRRRSNTPCRSTRGVPIAHCRSSCSARAVDCRRTTSKLPRSFGHVPAALATSSRASLPAPHEKSTSARRSAEARRCRCR